MHYYVIVDVFTTVALQGNPVVVFPHATGISTGRMQLIAREMNFPGTAFVLPARAGGDHRVRIFTPANELPFAGHPILGTAAVLGSSTKPDRLQLETAAGTIAVDFQYRRDRRFSATMHQPIPTWEPYERRDELLEVLGLQSSTSPVDAYRNGPRHVFVGVDTEAELVRLQPDQRALAEHPDMAAVCFAGAGKRWRIRAFAPSYGVSEDAATGSAAGPLAVHLGRQGLVPFGKQIEVVQGAEMGRPSRMFARAEGTTDQTDSVEVEGPAVITARGTLLI